MKNLKFLSYFQVKFQNSKSGKSQIQCFSTSIVLKPHSQKDFLNKLAQLRKKCILGVSWENEHNSVNFQPFLKISKLSEFYYLADSEMVLLTFVGRVVQELLTIQKCALLMAHPVHTENNYRTLTYRSRFSSKQFTPIFVQLKIFKICEI